MVLTMIEGKVFRGALTKYRLQNVKGQYLEKVGI